MTKKAMRITTMIHFQHVDIELHFLMFMSCTEMELYEDMDCISMYIVTNKVPMQVCHLLPRIHVVTTDWVLNKATPPLILPFRYHLFYY